MFRHILVATDYRAAVLGEARTHLASSHAALPVLVCR
jgi:hypothetical protein